MELTETKQSEANPPIASSSQQFTGDFLITFHMNGNVPSGRAANGNWQRLLSGSGWELYTQPPNATWKGFPLTYVSMDYWHLWMIGEFYGAKQTSFSSEATLRDLALGNKSASELNGHFLILGWNVQTLCWHIWTDRFGTIHAYYGENGQRTAISTYFSAVAKTISCTKLDWRGLTGFFGFGFFPQDRTFFENISILRPSSHYIFKADGHLLKRERYWQWPYAPDYARSYEDTVDEFGRIFNQIMTELIDCGRVAIPISGGLDSRCTVAALAPYDCTLPSSPKIWAYSYGYTDNSIETHIARRIAKARKLPFQAFTISPYLFNRLDLIMASVEGFQDITQCRQASVVNEIQHHADYLVAAHWGDVWLDDMGLVGGDNHSISDKDIVAYALQKIRKKGREWLLKNLCEPQLGGESSEAILQSMVREDMGYLSHIEDLDFRIKAFKTNQWSFRWTLASLRMFQAAAFPRLPFYDTRLADFFCTVPSGFMHKRQLQIDYLKRFAPDLAKISWQVYDTNLYHYHYFNSWLLPKRLLKKAWRILTRQQVIERNWEVQFFGDGGREGLEDRLLRSGLCLYEFIPNSLVHELFDQFYQIPLSSSLGYTVSMLLTFSVFLEHHS